MANNNYQKSNMDKLVSGISSKERKDILNRIKADDVDISVDTHEPDIDKKKEEKLDNQKALMLKYKHESAILKFILWIKSVFTNASIEEVYNANVVASLAKQLEREFPDLIDYKRKNLCQSFFLKFNDLKVAQDFFKPQVEAIESDPGVFYLILAGLVMPEICEEIRSSSDPYQYPLNSQIASDTRSVLLRRLDDILDSIPKETRQRMSFCSQSMEWLSAFVRLPLSSLLSKFSSTGGTKSCMFTQVKGDFPVMAKVLGSPVRISEETLNSMFISYPGMRGIWKFEPSNAINEEVIDSSHNASTEYSVINMFINTIPMKNLGKVIFENSLFVADTMIQSDVWIQKLREQWMIEFDIRWKMWNRDSQKEALKKKMKIFFGLMDFPKFPYHPWEKFSKEAPFAYDLTAGFLNYYFKVEYVKYASIMNLVTLEGDFAIQENRKQFSDAVSDFNSIIDHIEILAGQVSVNGDYGMEFVRYESSIKATSDREKLKVVVDDIGEKVSEILSTFTKSCREFENLLSAIISEESNSNYGPLSNMSKIMGRENKRFRETLERFLQSIKSAAEIVSELKLVDDIIL